MKNYRIKKYHGIYSTRYIPQEKILFWWRNVFAVDPVYSTFEEAKKELCKYLRKPAVEYIDFDCERDCK